MSEPDPDSLEEESFPPRRIGLFGGSFDPVHNGHMELASRAREIAELDEVIFIPCARSPHKDQPTVANDKQRVAMILEAIDDLDWATTSTVEMDRASPSYSWETAEYFAAEHPEADLYWILGTDQWENIENWSRPGILCDLLTFIIANRNDTPVRLRADWSQIELTFDHPASSTAIREGRGEPEWLHPEVIDNIAERGIYQSST